MSAAIIVQLRRVEGSLTRLLGTVQRRGFEFESVDAQIRPENNQWQVKLVFCPTARDVNLLCRQIQRLYEVTYVESVLEK